MRIRLSSGLLGLAGLLSVLPFVISGCLTTPTGGVAGGGTASPLFNSPPTVVLTADVTRGIAPLKVQFRSDDSTDDGLIVSRLWDFGDGTTSRDISPAHTFKTTGEFTVKLTLTDDGGLEASKTVVISVTQAPVAVIRVDRTSAASAPALFNFDGSGSFDPDGTIDRYQWDFDDGSRELLAVVVHTFATPGTYRVRLTVTDNTGVTNSDDQIIEVGIPTPTISFRTPPASITNIAVSKDSPLWSSVDFTVEPGVPRTIRAGLDRDRDACEAQAVVYDARTGNSQQRLLGHGAPVRAVAFGADGQTALTGSDDQGVRFYVIGGDPATGSVRATAAAGVRAVALSPDGARFVFGAGDGSVELHDIVTGALVRRFTGHALGVSGVAFSADGTRIATASDDKTSIVFNASTGQTIRVLGGTPAAHQSPVTAVAFSPNSVDVVLTGSLDKTAKLWRVSDGTVLRTFAGAHTEAVNAVAFSPDGQSVLTGSADRTARLWDASGGGIVRTFARHRGSVAAVAFSPDGKQVVTGSADGTAIVWGIETGGVVRTLAPCVSTVSSVAFSADGTGLLLGVAAQNDIPLDSTPPAGRDLNLSLPTPLNLTVLKSDQYPAQYALWAELDTDRTEPVRTYAAATVSVVAPFTDTPNVNTPRIPLINDRAAIIMAPTSKRQIFDLGPLSRGDRVFLSLLSPEGYGEFFQTADPFSVMVLDAVQDVYTWYQQEFVLFTRDAKLIIGHDSPSYYVVVDGCPQQYCGESFNGQSVSVRIERNVGVRTRQQRIFLNFNGASSVAIDGIGPVTIPPFKAEHLNPAWQDTPQINYTQLLKSGIVARMNALYGPWNIVVSTSDSPVPTPPYQTVHFDSFNLDPYIFGGGVLLGIASYIDPRNETLAGPGLIVASWIGQIYFGISLDEMALTIGNVATHESGHLLGLRHTRDALDVMSYEGSDTDPAKTFKSAPLWGGSGPEQFNEPPIGMQNAPQLFDEVVGPRP